MDLADPVRYSPAVEEIGPDEGETIQGLQETFDTMAQGLFARPGEHAATLRISTNAGDILPDAISLPRGLALKVGTHPASRRWTRKCSSASGAASARIGRPATSTAPGATPTATPRSSAPA